MFKSTLESAFVKERELVSTDEEQAEEDVQKLMFSGDSELLVQMESAYTEI